MKLFESFFGLHVGPHVLPFKAEWHTCTAGAPARSPLDTECGPRGRCHRHPKCKSTHFHSGSLPSFAWHQSYAAEIRNLNPAKEKTSNLQRCPVGSLKIIWMKEIHKLEKDPAHSLRYLKLRVPKLWTLFFKFVPRNGSLCNVEMTLQTLPLLARSFQGYHPESAPSPSVVSSEPIHFLESLVINEIWMS